MNKYRRNRIVVDQELQRSVVVSAIWPPAAVFVVVTACLVVLHYRLDSAASEAGVELEGVTPMLIATYAIFASAIAFVALHALRLSFRIAGPLYRFRVAYRDFTEGRTGARIRLRDGDLLANAADDLNAFLEWLEQQGTAGPRAPAASHDEEGEGVSSNDEAVAEEAGDRSV